MENEDKVDKVDKVDKELNEASKKWIGEAEKIKTVDQLAKFITHLKKDYDHDYGSIILAMRAGMVATFHVMDEDEGITGFQADILFKSLMMEMLYRDNKCGVRLIDFDKMLYPQHKSSFTTISKDTWDKVQAEAKAKVKALQGIPAAPEVKAHWQSIIDGKVPFGLKVKEKDE
ncbi:MAG: hypothetical protein PHI40_07260 [Caldisericia bacterium]|nr:hypothetical protein [Caldisericia bacterium]